MTQLEYFESYENYFWQWEDGQSVIAIPNAQTLAFTEQIVNLLEVLSLQGFPRFGPFLLAVAATSHKDTVLDALRLKLSVHLSFEDEMRDGFAFLKLLNALPDEFKKGTKRKVLFQAIFENSHNRLSIKNSTRIFSEFKKTYKVFGYLGDQNKIGINQSLIYKVQLIKINKKNESN